MEKDKLTEIALFATTQRYHAATGIQLTEYPVDFDNGLTFFEKIQIRIMSWVAFKVVSFITR